MTETVKITSLGQTLQASDGKSYGPFEASKAKPYLEVPLSIALVSGAPVYEEGAVADASKDVEDGVEVERIIKANHDLAADLKAEQGKVQDLSIRLNGERGKVAQLTAQLTEVGEFRELLAGERQYSRKLEDAIQGGDIEKARAALRVEQPAPEPEQEGAPAPASSEESEGTPVPDGFPLASKLAENGFDTLEKIEAGLRVAEGQEESPIRQIDGLGEKSEKTIKDALIKAKVKNFIEPKEGGQ
ncbi:hypothetical protein [Deinococcus sp. Marseille-Q6407]|uniref:hypothetical protein n=1 Tax=Deinococcus sp. Marseille-Q6407 TaxID=2969223 RepID=UPI0021BEDED3|nr:hypothetical protein [Deinococcus sp. Marseille-Q6407]